LQGGREGERKAERGLDIDSGRDFVRRKKETPVTGKGKDT